MSKKVKEQIQYDGPERMAPDIEDKLNTGETPFSDNPALPKKDDDEFDNSFEQLVASKRFKDVVEKVKQYTGLEAINGMNAFMTLQMLMAESVNKIKAIEGENKEYLENLAVKLVKNEMGVPDDAFQYDVEITMGMGEIDTDKLKSEPEEYDDEEIVQNFGIESDEAEEDLDNFMAAFEMFDMEKAKRRFINSLIQGASKKGHYMFALVKDELDAIDPELLNLYGIVMSINDLLYWILPDEQIMQMAGDGDNVEGTEEVDDETDPPTIRAKGFLFPILVHEIIKGVMEVLGTQGLPDDPRAAEMVMGAEDTTPYEIWDLRLGPIFWEKFRDAYPQRIQQEEMRELQNYLFSRFSMLTTDEFFTLAKLILKGDDTGKEILDSMVDDIIDELKKQDFEDATGEFEDNTTDEPPDDGPDDGGLKGLLGDLGISMS